MKKIIAVLISTALILSMSVTAFAGISTKKDDPNPLSALGSLLEDVLGGLSESSGDILNALSELAGNVSDFLAEAADQVKENLPEVIDDAGNAINDAGDAINDAGESVSDAISDLPESISEALNGLSSILSELAGAEGAAEDGSAAGSNNIAAPAPSTKIAGGWSVNVEFSGSMSTEAMEAFEAAISTLVGVDYVPATVLATQTVAGTNYAFLCTGTPVVPNAPAKWYIVTVYKDLKGEASILSIEEIELDNILTKEAVDDTELMGAWKIELPDAAAVLPDAAQNAYENASAGYTGVEFSPIALLGTQIVAGSNYRILCFGTTVTKTPVTSLYVIDIYENLQGESQITDAQLFDLTGYIDN